MIGGVPLFVNAVSSTFNPATLSLDAWYRASYAGPTWSPTASAGSSGDNGNLEFYTGDAPDAGSAVNGFTPALFDSGLNQDLYNQGQADYFISTTAWTVVMLFKADSFVAHVGDYEDTGLFSTTGGQLGMYVSSSGVVVWQEPSGETKRTVAVALSSATWAMCVGRYDGTNIKCRVSTSGGTTDATPVAVGTALSLTGLALTFGVSADAVSAWLEGNVLEIMTTTTALSDATLVSIRDYFNTRYALALT